MLFRSGALNKGIQEANARFAEFKLPLLVMHGEKDRLADPDGSKAIYANAGTEDKHIKIFAGMFHELVNEPEKEDILNEMLAWVEAHLE